MDYRLYYSVVEDTELSAPANIVSIDDLLQPVEDCNFKVAPTTRVFGRILNSETGNGVRTASSDLVQIADDETKICRELSVPDGFPSFPNNHRYGNRVNEKGEFEFRLGPGVYMFRLDGRDEFQSFVVKDEKEIEINFTTKMGAMFVLKGEVISTTGADGTPTESKPIGNAKNKVFISMRDIWETNTDKDGRFEIPLCEEQGVISVFSSDNKFAKIKTIQGKERNLVLDLEATGIINGRLIDQLGKPVANRKVYYGGDQNFSGYGGFVVTNSEGKFSISNIAPNWEYCLKTTFTSDAGSLRKINAIVEIKPGETCDVGDLVSHFTPVDVPHESKVRFR